MKAHEIRPGRTYNMRDGSKCYVLRRGRFVRFLRDGRSGSQPLTNFAYNVKSESSAKDAAWPQMQKA